MNNSLSPVEASRAQRVWRRMAPEATPLWARPDLRPMTAWAAYAAVAVIVALVLGDAIMTVVRAALAQGGTPAIAISAPRADNFFSRDYAGYRWSNEVVALTVLGVSVWLVARYHRIPWRSIFSPRPTPDVVCPKRQRDLVFLWAMASMVISQHLMAVIARLAPSGAVGGFAVPTPADVLWMTAYQGPTLLTTALREEIAVVGLLVILLAAARRPVWEIFTVAVAIKLSYHFYYGIPALGLIPFALAFVWLYHRTGRLWPLILAHATYNGFYAVKSIVLAAAAMDFSPGGDGLTLAPGG
jgi:membrane protease YdiL (CAAX protease family)